MLQTQYVKATLPGRDSAAVETTVPGALGAMATTCNPQDFWVGEEAPCHWIFGMHQETSAH